MVDTRPSEAGIVSFFFSSRIYIYKYMYTRRAYPGSSEEWPRDDSGAVVVNETVREKPVETARGEIVRRTVIRPRTRRQSGGTTGESPLVGRDTHFNRRHQSRARPPKA